MFSLPFGVVEVLIMNGEGKKVAPGTCIKLKVEHYLM